MNLFIVIVKVIMYISKSSGPNTNPLGTPKIIVNNFFYLRFLQCMAEKPSYNKKRKDKIKVA